MLSFKKGKPLCVITKCNKRKILKIFDDTEKDPTEYELPQNKLERFDKTQLNQLSEAIESKDPKYLDGKLLKTYNTIMTNGHVGTEYKTNDGVFSLCCNNDPNQRDSIYITGPSGSGKSTFIGNFIKEYIKRNPTNDIVLFSMKDEDPALDPYHPMRIKIDRGLIDDPIDLAELENSLVIFDDIDQIGDKKLQNAVHNLRDRILEVGRSKNISICTVAHQITNYKASRICLNEADYVIFFPKSGSKYQVSYFLKNYAGMSKDDINKVFNLKTRWCILKKSYPMAVIYQSGAYVV